MAIGGGKEIPVRLRGRFNPDESLLSTEIRRKLWDGQIALKIDLAVDDTISIDKPRSLYVSEPINFTREMSTICFWIDHGTARKLPFLHLDRCEVALRSVCTARLDRELQRLVVRLQLKATQVERAHRGAI